MLTVELGRMAMLLDPSDRIGATLETTNGRSPTDVDKSGRTRPLLPVLRDGLTIALTMGATEIGIVVVDNIGAIEIVVEEPIPRSKLIGMLDGNATPLDPIEMTDGTIFKEAEGSNRVTVLLPIATPMPLLPTDTAGNEMTVVGCEEPPKPRLRPLVPNPTPALIGPSETPTSTLGRAVETRPSVIEASTTGIVPRVRPTLMPAPTLPEEVATASKQMLSS